MSSAANYRQREGEARSRVHSRSRERKDRDEREDRSHRRRSRSKDSDREPRAKGRDHRSRHEDHRKSRSPRRSRSRSRSPRRHRKLSRSRSRTPVKDRERRRDRSRERRKRSRSRSCSVFSDTSSASERRRHRKKKEKKARKKDKKEKKKSGAVSHQWGKYGLINDSDLYNKEQEFRAWLVEERKINPETISKEQTKKEFAQFVEDYNTATLPHEKFYHMEAYERRMSALRAGEYVPPADDSYDPNADLRALESSHRRRAVERETYMSKEQLQELRRVQNERIEAGKMKLLGMDIKHNMGVRMDGSMFDG
ncbi:hypothetical protein POSPLADRAFT_1144440 [Postia placenta MAD-698-R-SB12]|uniref:Uncharacterized protein n=1 Tax=Postia placenta MAD-698-R-SB12 TaxID=670580 RepID=A0A1X6MZL8_9APHY|nr:hypothetical protein POSPLADRAFT_1144440 [Postia placenta MAD-698-R-SB12]OSX61811.1 hypothetical protein POSPLADRAFT_1144440 [Postia placenta MAD-698-R-SB12]